LPRLTGMDVINGSETFARLHTRGNPLLLANAWDVGSAVAIVDAGAKAIATTSAGVAWSFGIADGGGLGADRAAAVVERIAAAVPVPVSADIEAGYGIGPADVEATVTAVVQAGAVGINLEDLTANAEPSLFDPAEQAERLAAARAAAERSGVRIWINARTDVYLAEIGPPQDRLAAVLERAAVYAAAGADSLFVPGLNDLTAIAELASGPLPVSVLAGPGSPTVAEFAAAGAVRISLGSAIVAAAYAVAARAATEFFSTGSYDSVRDRIPYAELNRAIAARS
jgi:2-methylisocitrate lyase-like PEP mutase family enzyme